MDLTRRQKQVAELIAQGKKNKEIAQILNLSAGTIKVYIHAMCERIGARNRTDLALRYENILSRPIR